MAWSIQPAGSDSIGHCAWTAGESDTPNIILVGVHTLHTILSLVPSKLLEVLDRGIHDATYLEANISGFGSRSNC